jgi:hypothetical protein
MIRGTLTLLAIACALYVAHWIVPQPNGLGDLAGVLSGAALLYFLATAEITGRK